MQAHHPGHFIIAAGVANDPALPNVEDDLGMIVQYFTEELGYEHALPELIGAPTADLFRRRLSDWFAASERCPQDCIVLYFSGRIEIDKTGRHYLMLADSKSERPSGIGFVTATLATIPFEAGRVRQLLVVLDSCFSGTGATDTACWASDEQPDEGRLLQLVSAARRIVR